MATAPPPNQPGTPSASEGVGPTLLHKRGHSLAKTGHGVKPAYVTDVGLPP